MSYDLRSLGRGYGAKGEGVVGLFTVIGRSHQMTLMKLPVLLLFPK